MYFKPSASHSNESIVMSTERGTSRVDYYSKEFKRYFSWLLQVFAQINFQGVLNEFSDFSHAVGKPFELESGHFWYGFQLESLTCVGSYFAMLAKVLVCAFKFIYCEKA